MKFKKVLNQFKVGILSEDLKTFLGLTTYVSIFAVLGIKPQTIWPQIDNLSGVIKLSGLSTNDYFTQSSIHSPRIFTILFIRFLTLTLHVRPETAISILGSIVVILGLPLFLVAVKKRFSGKALGDLKLIECLVFFICLSLLSTNYFHEIEVNGFFINPFLQGATTSNLSILLFLIGYLAKKKTLKYCLYALSLLFHISTGLFMFLIFKATLSREWREKSKKFQNPIYLSITFLMVGALGIYTLLNLPSWSYYIKSRAANHFIITTSDLASLQFSLIILSIFCASLYLTPNYRYKYISFLVLSSICISLTAYPLYTVPYVLACLCLVLKIRENLCVPPIFILFGLFVLQAFPSDLISIPAAMLLPATRFTSIVTLYLLFLLGLEIGTRARKITHFPFKNGYISKYGGTITVILLIISLTNILLYARTTNENFLVLKKTIAKENTISKETKSELIFLDVPSQGWREFGNIKIFVDEYPFWGNLEEYRNRNMFRQKLLKLAFSGQINLKEVETLKGEFEIQANLVLVTTKRNSLYFRNFSCTQANSNYFCDLEITK